MHDLFPVQSSSVADICRCLCELHEELIVSDCIVLLLSGHIKIRSCRQFFTYGSIKSLCEEDGDLDLVVVTDEALTGSNKVACWLSRLHFEHDGHVTSVDEAKVGRGPIALSRLENQFTDGVYRDKLTPVLGRRALGLIRRLHRHLNSLKNNFNQASARLA